MLFAPYHPPSQVDEYFLGEVGKSIDKYSQIYSKCLLICNFNADESEPVAAQFLHNYNPVNIIHENTCYKSMNNRSCIDFIITNSPNSFQNTSTFSTGLSDFHQLVVTVLKTSFIKTAPEEIHYRDYKKFNADDFKTGMKQNLATSSRNYENFE